MTAATVSSAQPNAGQPRHSTPHSGTITGAKTGAITWAVLLAFTLLARSASLGNPDYHIDETFYMLVGNAMHHGAVPYVDIWDRKPPGLFAFYWLLAGISPSVLSFQIAAIGFVTATAWCVVRIAVRWSDRVGALLAGAIYIAWLQPLLGGGGQAPVFYNLFIAGAVLLLVRRIERSDASANFAEAVLAGLLCGIAVSFKPTAVFEGSFVVLAFVAAEWRSSADWRRPALLLAAVGTAAALPTVAAAGWFFVQGQFEIYLQATIESNFQKTRAAPIAFWTTVRYLAVLTLVLVAGAIAGLITGFTTNQNQRFNRTMLVWVFAALGGFLAVPNFYSHYALPLVPVLAVCSAPYLATRPFGQVLAALSIIWALSLGQSFEFTRMQQSRAQFERITAVIRANMPTSTLYVFDGSVGLYAATGARLPSRFPFPDHLMLKTEASAIGADPLAELDAVLRKLPDVIVWDEIPRPDANPAAVAALRATLEQHYTLVCRLPGRTFEHPYHSWIYARNRVPDRTLCLSPAQNVTLKVAELSNS